MRRNSVTGPFWTMLMITFVNVGYNYIVAKVILKMTHLLLFPFLMLILWPTILLTEALIYWIIRKRIVYPKYVWGHIACMLSAFVAVPLAGFFANGFFSRYMTKSEMFGVNRIGQRGQFIVFWSSVILGHVFFAMALKKSFTRDPVPGKDAENINLLDDVLN